MTLEEAKEIVFKEKPIFAEIYKKYGNKNWLEYANENFPKGKPLLNENKKELLEAMKKILTPLIGEEKTNRTLRTIEKTGFVSTTDHHGILCHPFFANNALVRSHPSIFEADSSLIALTCGGISLSNSSFPRGIFFHDKELEEKRISFVSLKERHRPVYGLPSFSYEKIEKIKDSLNYFNIDESKKNKLKEFYKKIKANKQILEQDKYSNQLTIINDILWDTLFGNTRGNLVYLEAESLVRELLLSVHLEKDTDIHKIIFNREWRNSYIKNFENVPVAHNTLKQKGSHLFWYIDKEKKERKQLWIVNENLESMDKKIAIPLEPSIILEYLISFKLLPTTAFCYSILSFYYGLTLGGGPFQIQYLRKIKEAYEKTLLDFDKIPTNPSIRTDIFTGDLTLIGIGNKKKTIPASLIDALIYRDNNTHEAMDRIIESFSIKETLDPMMSEFVTIITGKKEIISNLPKIHKTFNI